MYQGSSRTPLKSIYALLCGALVLLSACNHTSGPKELSSRTYTATQRAVNALQRASESRDSAASVFNPKLEAAAKAADEVYFDMGSQKADGYAATQVRSCVDELRQYRSNFDSQESVSRPIEEQLHGLKATAVKDANDVVARNGKELDDCIAAAKAYL